MRMPSTWMLARERLLQKRVPTFSLLGVIASVLLTTVSPLGGLQQDANDATGARFIEQGGRAPNVYFAKFHTTKGDFTIKVTRAWAPIGADRFYMLVGQDFYDGASIFRVVPGFAVQFGIPADPLVGRSWEHSEIKDDPVKESNYRGYVTFASAGPNTRTTQVFINLTNNARLDGMGFVPFGQVVDGMSVVESFYGGYGESPDQSRLMSEGKTYVDKYFPKLDSIITGRIVPVALSGSAEDEGEAVGDALVKQGQFREALDHYMTALQHLTEYLPPDIEQRLREKVIKVVLLLNPPPAIPQDAIRHAAYAQAAVDEAQKDANPSHLNDAVNELEKALRIAPWWAQAYFNLGAVLQKANRPGEAAQALQLYLLADPHASNAQDVQMEIYKLQYEAKQQGNSQ